MAGGAKRLRIIGGMHRGRILKFIPADGLRPTPDRVRETVFNWLQPVIAGARCLDMFAGSGAMGLEALSRGAAEVVFVESQQATADQIQQHLHTLDAGNGYVYRQPASDFIRQAASSFDVVFLDPPYGKGLLLASCEQLEKASLLSACARVYLESEFAVQQQQLPAGWELARAKQAGQVFYHLAVR